MLDYKMLDELIHEQKNKEDCKYALELLQEHQEGWDEILRYSYMKNAYFRLGEKEKVIKCGKRETECFEQYFADKNVLSEEVLCAQCNAIEQKLSECGSCNIHIDAHVNRKDAELFISLKDKEINISTVCVEEEVKKICKKRSREEIYILFRAIVREIKKAVEETIRIDLYKEVKIHVSKSVGGGFCEKNCT